MAPPSRFLPFFLSCVLLPMALLSSCNSPPAKWEGLIDQNIKSKILRICDELDETERHLTQYIVVSKLDADYTTGPLKFTAYQLSLRFPSFDKSIFHVGADKAVNWEELDLTRLGADKFRDLLQDETVTISNEKYCAYLAKPQENAGRTFESFVADVDSLPATNFIIQNEDLIGAYRVLGIALRSFLENAVLTEISLKESGDLIRLSLHGSIDRRIIRSRENQVGIWELTYSRGKKSFVEQTRRGLQASTPFRVISNFEFSNETGSWFPTNSVKIDEYKENALDSSFVRSRVQQSVYTYYKADQLPRDVCYASFFGLPEPPNPLDSASGISPVALTAAIFAIVLLITAVLWFISRRQKSA